MLDRCHNKLGGAAARRCGEPGRFADAVNVGGQGCRRVAGGKASRVVGKSRSHSLGARVMEGLKGKRRRGSNGHTGAKYGSQGE